MDSEEFRRRGREVIDFITKYQNTVLLKSVTHDRKDGYLKELLPLAAPVYPESFDDIMVDLKKYIVPGLVRWRHPRYFAYLPSGGSYPSILADMLISAINCPGFSWAAGPASTELEIIILDWLAKMINLPAEFLSSVGKKGGGGVLQASSSDAVLLAMTAARHAKTKEMNRRNPALDRRSHLPLFMAYCSKICYPSILKVAEVAMVQVRSLETDDKRRLRGDKLAQAMKEDAEKGAIPFFVFANLGTPSCCSCDALEEIGPVCENFQVWLHVDAAYAGSALICPEFLYLLNGIDFVDSFSIDPSMWMLMNFDCCALWVRDRYKFTEALVIDPVYLEHPFTHNAIEFRHWGIPLSRRFRALKLWIVIRKYGVEGLQKHIRKHVSLAKLFESFVRDDARFVLENDVLFGLVCFRLRGSNALNVKLLSSVNDSGKMFIVGTMLDGNYVLRFCICSENTQEEDVIFAWKLIKETADKISSLPDYKIGSDSD